MSSARRPLPPGAGPAIIIAAAVIPFVAEAAKPLAKKAGKGLVKLGEWLQKQVPDAEKPAEEPKPKTVEKEKPAAASARKPAAKPKAKPKTTAKRQPKRPAPEPPAGEGERFTLGDDIETG